MSYKLTKKEGVIDSADGHIKSILDNMEALKEYGCDFIDHPRAFDTYYKRYLQKFEASKAIIANSNSSEELYPLEDPRLEIAFVIKHYCLTDKETLKFIAHFGMNSLKQIARVTAPNAQKYEEYINKRYID